MPQTLDQIIAARRQLYDPQRALINQQVAQLPDQEQAAVSGLDAQLNQRYDDITNQANADNMFYSGKPVAEKQRQLATFYAPERAKLAGDFLNQRNKLTAGLLGINQDEYTSAEQLRNDQVKAEADAEYKRAQLAAKASKSAKVTKEDRQSSFNQDLISAFQQVSQGQIQYRPFIREQVAQQLAAEYGIPIDQAQKQVNSVFTDSWDAGMQVKGGYRRPGT